MPGSGDSLTPLGGQGYLCLAEAGEDYHLVEPAVRHARIRAYYQLINPGIAGRKRRQKKAPVAGSSGAHG